MRFVWAVVAFVIAAGLVAMGVAQRTVFLGPDSETIKVSSEEDLPFTVIDSDVFEALPEALPGESGTLTISSDGPIFATYARTTDVLGWLGDQRFTHATADGGDIDVATAEPTVELEGEPEGRNPAGSDLWLESFTADGTMEENFSFPDGMELSVLIASDGTEPAPATIEVTWPIDNSTPSAPWFIGAGIGVLVIGLLLYILAVVHSRRSRGPRRKGQPVPLTGAIAIARDRHVAGELDEAQPEPTGEADAASDAEPRDDSRNDDGPDDGRGASAGTDPGAAEPDETGTERGTARREASPWWSLRRRARLALPVLGLSVALMAGCTADVPAAGPTPSPSATEEAADTEAAQQPAITETQADRIIADLSEKVAEADEKNDASLAAKRLAGTALEIRKVNYSLRGDIDDYSSLPQIPAEPIAILLPQAFDGWPRTVLTVVEDAEDETVAPTIITLRQEDPWHSYKATYVSQLRPSAEVPDLAPPYQGAALVPPDSSFLQLAPEEVAAAYASVLKDGEKSEYAELFDIENDGFLAEVTQKRKKTLSNFNETGKDTGTLSFGQKAGSSDPFALMTLHSGAIVGVSVVEEETVKPTDADAVIRFEDDPVLQAFTGEETSAGGVRTRYLDQLFFYVPSQGSEEPIRLLGSSSSIRGAEILEAENDDEDE
ncbi:glycosyl transferase [Microbacterium halotolerans]|uniref:glycosyl transferase n=1 Tax=Microbacterium halotolerans TaxID=246613 RepID=UPI0013C31D3B|nr:glycosyl transferase [Microbacterium halotolerans]